MRYYLLILKLLKYSENTCYAFKLKIKNVLIIFNKKYQTWKRKLEVLLYIMRVLKWYAVPSYISLLQPISMPAYVYIYYLRSYCNTGVMMKNLSQRA